MITTFEHGLLKQMAEIDDAGLGPESWGAAVGEATEFLHAHGYLRRIIKAESVNYELTEKGLEMARTPYSSLKSVMED